MEIILNDCASEKQHLFAPGDIVSGVLKYTIPDSGASLDTVSITLEGRGQIKPDYQAGRASDVELDHCMFSQEKLLFRGPYKMHHQLMEWPFDFELPTQRRLPGKSLPLPPSISQHFESSWNQPLFTVIIKYELKAKASADAILFQKNATAEKRLTVRPVLSHQPTSTSQAVQLHHTVQTTTLQKLRRILKPKPASSESSSGLEIQITLPHELYHGQRDKVTVVLWQDAQEKRPITTKLTLKAILKSSLDSIDDRNLIREMGSYVFCENTEIYRYDASTTLSKDFGLASLALHKTYLPDFASTTPYFRYKHLFEIVATIDQDGHSIDYTATTPVIVLPRPAPGGGSTLPPPKYTKTINLIEREG